MSGSGNGHSDKGHAGNGGGAKPGESIFKAKPPEGHAKKVSEVLGEIVWLMSQSPIHKQFFIADLEWFVMTPVLLQQFRMFYADDRPLGVLFWGFVSDEVEARLSQGITKLRPQDCPRGIEPKKVGGDRLWVLRQRASQEVEAIAPFGGAEEMVKDLKAKVFGDMELRYVAVGEGGRNDVRVV